MVPRSFSPSAFAALPVTPASASSGVMRNSVQAMFMASSSELIGDEPGLQSVATAIGTWCLRKSSMGGSCCFAQRVERAGHDAGHRAGGGHCRYAVFIQVFEVIRR
jgi:hypothetical protein